MYPSRQIVELIGKDNVNLSGKQVDEIVELLTKEEHLKNEEKIEKALAKSIEERQQQQQQQPTTQKSSSDLPELEITNLEDKKHILQQSSESTKTLDQTSLKVSDGQFLAKIEKK